MFAFKSSSRRINPKLYLYVRTGNGNYHSGDFVNKNSFQERKTPFWLTSFLHHFPFVVVVKSAILV